ncbi:VOC family protein [Jannaschia sp. CCS1]|uniref:VOC family protein n=1 Tax=Jannaschia sp. (strain CCS1) TaxID=290400 RepID=UPI000053CCE4|nr:VOC family protein [Jannaschia sp. CCS1]ABD54681.1 Glyoxalase/bleomycin resistance protein/dioxygenase [Jannaschia sp. CCS1]
MADFVEIGSDDPTATKAFFADVFGWQWEAFGDGDGGLVRDGDRQVGLHVEDTPLVVPYFTVDDIVATARRVTEAGGQVMGGVAEEGMLGRFATCTDPRGARFGLHQRA